MGIGIDDHDADAGAFFLKVAHGDGDIVKDAESFTATLKGVVGSSGETDGNAFG